MKMTQNQCEEFAKEWTKKRITLKITMVLKNQENENE